MPKQKCHLSHQERLQIVFTSFSSHFKNVFLYLHTLLKINILNFDSRTDAFNKVKGTLA